MRSWLAGRPPWRGRSSDSSPARGSVPGISSPLAFSALSRAGLLVLLSLALWLSMLPQAQAQTTGTLVSNMSQTPGSLSSSRHAQPFTTGARTAGYGVGSVELYNGTYSTTTGILVRIAPNGSNNRPDLEASDVVTLTNPTTITSNAINTYSAPPGAVLTPDTRYHIVVTNSSGTSGTSVGLTGSPSEDSASASDWNIGNTRYLKSTGASTWSSSSSSLLRIRVNAVLEPESATVSESGKTLTLTYDRALKATSVPAASAFTVKVTPVGGTVETAALASSNPVSVSGSTVVLTLPDPIGHGDAVTLSYAPPGTSPIEDQAGIDAVPVTDLTVANDSTVPRISIEAVYEDATPDLAPPVFRVTRSLVSGSALAVTFEITQADTYISNLTQTATIPADRTSVEKELSASPAVSMSGLLTATLSIDDDTKLPSPQNTASIMMKVPPLEANRATMEFASYTHAVVEGDEFVVTLKALTPENVAQPRKVLQFALLTEIGTAVIPDSFNNEEGDYIHISENQSALPSKWEVAGERFTQTVTKTIRTIDDNVHEVEEFFYVRLDDTPGSRGRPTCPDANRVENKCSTVVTVTDNDPLALESVSITSTPVGGTVYNRGEKILITAAYNADITVDTTGGTPRIAFDLGGTTRNATYTEGTDTEDTDTKALVFSYTVKRGDYDLDGISWAANALSRNGGTIKLMHDVASNRVDVPIAHVAQTHNPNHKVDGGHAAPTLPMAQALVSNIGQTQGSLSEGLGGKDVAQEFTTGGNAGGYSLANIDLRLVRIGSRAISAFSVKLFSGSATGTEVASFTVPTLAPNTTGNYRFTPTSAITLTKDTTYWVVAEGSGAVEWVYSNSTNLDSGSAVDWRINKRRQRREASSTGAFSDLSTNTRMLMSINGSNFKTTGTPTITGTPKIGQTLTASQGTIADADGIPSNVSFTYQWIRVDGSNERNIAGATSSTYTLTEEDGAHQVKVRVSFNDSAGFAESRTSQAYPAGGTIEAAHCSAADRRGVWCATMTVGTWNGVLGYKSGSAGGGRLTQGTFQYDNKSVLVTSISYSEALVVFSVIANAPDGAFGQDHLLLRIGVGTDTKIFPIKGMGSSSAISWRNPGIAWSINEKVPVKIVRVPANTRETSAPEIAGTAQIGEVLTASHDAVTDVNGIGDDAVFTYQWVRVDGDSETDIEDATESTYTLQNADYRKQVKVQVSFRDYVGHTERRKSEAFPSTGTVEGSPSTPAHCNPEDHLELWCATLTVGSFTLQGSPGSGFASGEGGTLEPGHFDYRTATGRAATLQVQQNGTLRLQLQGSGTIPSDGLLGTANLVLEVVEGADRKVFPIENPLTTTTFSWGNSGLSWTDGDNVQIKLKRLGEFTEKGPGLDVPPGPNGERTQGWLRVRWDERLGASGVTGYKINYWKTTRSDENFQRTNVPDADARQYLMHNLHSGARYHVQVCERIGNQNETGQCSGYSQVQMPAASARNQINVEIEFPDGSTMKQVSSEDTQLPWRYRVSGIYDSSKDVFEYHSSGVAEGNVILQFEGEDRMSNTDNPGVRGPYLARQGERARVITLGHLVFDGVGTGYIDESFDIKDVSEQKGKGTLMVRLLEEGTIALVGSQGPARGDTHELCVEFVYPVSGVEESCGSVGGGGAGGSRSAAAEATFENLPPGHDGTNGFTVGLRFSGAPAGLTAADDAASVLEVTGGTVTGARSTSNEADAPWEVTIEPDGTGDVTVRVPARACTEPHAVCIGGQPLAEAVETMVSALQDVVTKESEPEDVTNLQSVLEDAATLLPVVSIEAPAATPVAEGTALAFTLRRTETTDEPLTVNVAVTETGDVLGADAPDSVTFAASSAEATLRVPTVDDATVEDASTVTATLSSGTGYEIGTDATAEGMVESEDLDPITARFTQVPDEHDGSSPFVVQFKFSHEMDGYGYRTVQSELFDVTGGTIEKASRLAPPSNRGWELQVRPHGREPVTLEARKTTDCAAEYAACDADGRKFDGRLTLTVLAISQPAISISGPSQTPMAEGEALAFTLTRTGSATGALSVGVSVTETGDVLDGTPPASVTFQSGSSEAFLRLPTVDDEKEEDASTVTVSLTEGTEYTVDADAGTAEGVVESEDLDPITARFTQEPDGHDGSNPFVVQFKFSHEMDGYSYKTVQGGLFDVTGGTIEKASRLAAPSNREWEIRVRPDGQGPVTLEARETADCAAQYAACDTDGRKFDGALETTVQGPPLLSVADATVDEAQGATLEFIVTLSRALTGAVSVDYATSDGTATAGDDYTATSDTLNFRPGETTKTISVPVLDDLHNDPGETLTLTLSNATGAVIEDATATGTIRNTDPMPTAWLTRFGRTATDHAIDAIGQRVGAGGETAAPAPHLTLGGRRIDSLIGLFRGGPTQDDTARSDRADLLADEPAWARMDRLRGELSGAPSFGATSATGVTDTAGGEESLAGWPSGGSSLGHQPLSGLPNTGLGTDSTMGSGALSHGGSSHGGPSLGGPSQGTPYQGGAYEGGTDPVGTGPIGTAPVGTAEGGMHSNGGAPVYGDASGGSGWTSVLDAIAGAAGDAQWAQLYREGRSMTGLAGQYSLRDALMGSSFFYAPYLNGADPNGAHPDGAATGPLGRWAVWGTTAATRFSGAEDTLSINGDVATATLGFDSQFGRWLTGLALSYSDGQGGYTHPDFLGGELESTLTQLTPYARFALNERTALWGTVGYGTGRMTLSTGGAAVTAGTDVSGTNASGADASGGPPPLAAGLTSTMAAVGGRMELSRSLAFGGLTLAVLSDARFSRIASDDTEGMAGVAGDTSRVRLMLEGRGLVTLVQSVSLTPSLKAGLRHDGGDAETGAGLEVVAGLGVSAGSMSVQLDARGLLAHKDAAYEEWGVSASLTYRPRPDGTGLSVTMGSSFGAAQSGLEAMWAQTQPMGPIGGAAPLGGAYRAQAEVAYGLIGKKGRALWTPYLAADAAEGGMGVLRIGARMTAESHARAELELMRESAAPGSDRPQAGYGIRLVGSFLW